jgi:non-ribosomal peptide synthetase-like protein
MRWLYRLMGAKIGRDSELSTSLSGRYDLITVGENCFIADDVILGEETCRQGWITLEPVTLGDRVFIGNDAVVPSGSELVSDTLIGIKSLTPPASETRNKKGIWFGSPTMSLPVRQTFDSIGTQWTYSPPRWKRIARAVFEAFSVSFPSMLFITLGTYAVELLTPAITSHDMAQIIPQFLAAGTLVSIALVVTAALMKWLLMGKYRPTVKPMWSWWALRSEAIAVLYWGLAGNAMLDHLCGSPFLPLAMRMFGAKIGKGVFLDTTDITEFDCVSVGDFCAINTTSALQTHLYEDRVMKVGKVTLGNCITVGANSTVLYDTHIGDFARIGPLTIIMKGESLPPHTAWAGAPAQPVTSVPRPQVEESGFRTAEDEIAAEGLEPEAIAANMRQAS